MKNLAFPFLFLLFISPSLSAFFRFANFYSNGPNLYVFLNNQPFISDVTYENVTSYLPAGVQEHTQVSLGANTDPNVAWLSASLNVDAGGYYTIVATRNQTTSSLLVYSDDLTEPDFSARFCHIRIIHTAAGISNLGVEIGNQTVSSLPYSSASPYVNVIAGSTSLVLKVAGVPVYRGTLFLQRGVVYTVFLEPLISVRLVEDLNAYKAEVRLCHVSPDAAAFKFTMSDISFDKVSFAQHTDYKSLSSGNFSFALNFSDGKVVQSPAFYFFASLSLSTVVVHGWSNRPESPLQITILNDSEAPTNGSCFIRTANFAPDAPIFYLNLGSFNRTLNYAMVRDYEVITPGTYVVTFGKAGETNSYQSTIGLAPNTAYDIFVIGTSGRYQLNIEELRASPSPVTPHGSLSGGDIAGIVIGVVGGSIVIVLFMIWYSNRLTRYQNI